MLLVMDCYDKHFSSSLPVANALCVQMLCLRCIAINPFYCPVDFKGQIRWRLQSGSNSGELGSCQLH